MVDKTNSRAEQRTELTNTCFSWHCYHVGIWAWRFGWCQEYGFLCKTSRLFIFPFQAADIYMLVFKCMPDGGVRADDSAKEWHRHHFVTITPNKYHYFTTYKANKQQSKTISRHPAEKEVGKCQSLRVKLYNVYIININFHLFMFSHLWQANTKYREVMAPVLRMNPGNWSVSVVLCW